jgi:hypothetical protein
MIETIPAPSHRQGNFCALDAARRNSKKLQTHEWCSESFSVFALDGVFT